MSHFYPIPICPNYEINREGEVRNIKTKNILKPFLKDGYYRINLYKNGKTYIKPIHRLLALTFIPNPENLPVVDHIDRNKTNNSLNNLRWASIKTNVNNSDGVGNKPKKVMCVETKIIYPSISKAAKLTGIHRTNINRAVIKKYLKAGGYHWSYVEGGDDL